MPDIHNVSRNENMTHTLVMNFLHVVRISFAKVALNIITCLWWGVMRKISWTSRRMSEGGEKSGRGSVGKNLGLSLGREH